jgi:hypothetical protein
VTHTPARRGTAGLSAGSSVLSGSTGLGGAGVPAVGGPGSDAPEPPSDAWVDAVSSAPSQRSHHRKHRGGALSGGGVGGDTRGARTGRPAALHEHQSASAEHGSSGGAARMPSRSVGLSLDGEEEEDGEGDGPAAADEEVDRGAEGASRLSHRGPGESEADHGSASDGDVGASRDVLRVPTDDGMWQVAQPGARRRHGDDSSGRSRGLTETAADGRFTATAPLQTWMAPSAARAGRTPPLHPLTRLPLAPRTSDAAFSSASGAPAPLHDAGAALQRPPDGGARGGSGAGHARHGIRVRALSEGSPFVGIAAGVGGDESASQGADDGGHASAAPAPSRSSHHLADWPWWDGAAPGELPPRSPPSPPHAATSPPSPWQPLATAVDFARPAAWLGLFGEPVFRGRFGFLPALVHKFDRDTFPGIDDAVRAWHAATCPASLRSDPAAHAVLHTYEHGEALYVVAAGHGCSPLVPFRPSTVDGPPPPALGSWAQATAAFASAVRALAALHRSGGAHGGVTMACIGVDSDRQQLALLYPGVAASLARAGGTHGTAHPLLATAASRAGWGAPSARHGDTAAVVRADVVSLADVGRHLLAPFGLPGDGDGLFWCHVHAHGSQGRGWYAPSAAQSHPGLVWSDLLSWMRHPHLGPAT